MKINKNNYQQFILDYLEGNLDRDVVLDFQKFLNDNPEINQEIELLLNDPVAFPEESNTDDFKNRLKHSVNEQQINEQNIEEFIIARIENELNPEKEEQLSAFLDKYPEWKKISSAFALTKLIPDTIITYDGKAALKRSTISYNNIVHTGNYEEYLIALFEGDLNDDEKQAARNFIKQNSEAASFWNALQKTKLYPDSTVVFDAKRSLKKHSGVSVIKLTNALAVAASFLLIAMFWFLIPRHDEYPGIAEDIKNPVIINDNNNIAENVEQSEIGITENSNSFQSANKPVRYRTASLVSTTPEVEMPVKTQTRSIGTFAENTSFTMDPYALNPVALVTAQNRTLAIVQNDSILPDHASPDNRTIDAFLASGYNYVASGEYKEDLSLPSLIQWAKPQERINKAGQLAYAKWNDLKSSFRE